MRKRRKDDFEQKKRLDQKAKSKLASGRAKKLSEKEKRAGGTLIKMPEVFVSNQMKQQRNFVHYKRHKRVQNMGSDVQRISLPADQRIPVDVLLCVVRIRESRNTSPQAQKILNELGLKEINNCAFLMANPEVIKKLLLVADYVAYGQPDKKLVEEVLRTRGFLKTPEHKRVPMQDNILIEQLLGSQGVICLEDLVDAFY